MTVILPQNVAEGINAVKARNSCNMNDSTTVVLECEELGFFEAAHWIRNNVGRYNDCRASGYMGDGGPVPTAEDVAEDVPIQESGEVDDPVEEEEEEEEEEDEEDEEE
tara:strand:+ start:421 stop:744 length:324 start_codon:yes stop_codon:yes gene_type:complete